MTNAGLSYLTAALSLSSAATMLTWWHVCRRPTGDSLRTAALGTAFSFGLAAVTAAFAIIFASPLDHPQ